MFEVPVSKASLKQNRFEFVLPGSKKVHSLPLLKFIDTDLADRFIAVGRQLSGTDEPSDEAKVELAAVMVGVLDRYCPDLKLSVDQREALLAAWQEASNITAGE